MLRYRGATRLVLSAMKAVKAKNRARGGFGIGLCISGLKMGAKKTGYRYRSPSVERTIFVSFALMHIRLRY
jgi:hypothetical protein